MNRPNEHDDENDALLSAASAMTSILPASVASAMSASASFSRLKSSYVLHLDGQQHDISNLACSTEKARPLYPNLKGMEAPKEHDEQHEAFMTDWTEQWLQGGRLTYMSSDSGSTTGNAGGGGLHERTSSSNLKKNDSSSESDVDSARSHPSYSNLMARKKEKVRDYQEEKEGKSSKRGDRSSSSDSSRGGSPPSYPAYLRVDLDPDGKPVVEIGQVKVPYIGSTSRTKAAIRRKDKTVSLDCPNCRESLVCMVGLRYVLCSTCKTISSALRNPIAELSGEGDEEEPHGVGIGLQRSKYIHNVPPSA